MEATSPLVGRDDEIETLIDHMGQALTSKGSLVLISGNAGLGKSRLVQYLIEKAEKAGFLFTIGRCALGTSSDYQPFREVFSDFFGTESTNGLFIESSPIDIAFNSLNLLKVESLRNPLLIILEDIHWADSLTIHLSHFLARNISDQRILMIGTYRPEDLTTDVEGAEHPLKEAVQNMRKEELLTEISLSPISLEDATKAMEGMLGSKIDPDLIDQILRDSKGNPLFFLETLRALISAGALSYQDNIWRAIAGKEQKVPSSIKQMINPRLSKLTKRQNQLVEIASVIGEYFQEESLQEMSSLRPPEIVHELDYIAEKTSLIVKDEDGWRFSHEKLRTAIYDDLPDGRRKQIHLHHANVLESKHLDESQYVALSWHFYQAGEQERCINYSFLGGKIFLKHKAPMDAIKLLRRSEERIPLDDEHQEMRLELLEALGDAFSLLYNYSEAWHYYELLLDSCTDKKRIARVYRKSAKIWTPFTLGKGDPSKAYFLLDQAESRGEPNQEEKAYLERERADLLYADFKNEEAIKHTKQAIESFQSCGNEVMVIDTTIDLVCTMWPFNAEEGIILAESVLPRAYALGDRHEIVRVECELSHMLQTVGRYEESIVHFSRSIAFATEVGLFGDIAVGFADRSLSHYMNGNYQESLSDGLQSEKFARKLNDLDIFRALWRIAYASLELNDLSRAEHCLDEMLKIMNNTSESGFHLFMKGVTEAIRGRLLFKQLDYSSSEQAFSQSIGHLDEAGGLDTLAAIVHLFFAESYIEQGKRFHANDQLSKAYDTYAKIHNHTQMKKIDTLREKLIMVR